MPQWKPRPGASDAAGKRRADHDGICSAGDRLGDVSAGTHAAVGDDVAVLAGLVQVTHASSRCIRDRGALRHADAEHASRSCTHDPGRRLQVRRQRLCA